MTDPSRAPRILHVAQPTIAGVAVFVRNVARHQHRIGWQVTVACPSDGWLAEELRALGVPVVIWEATRNPGPGLVAEAVALRAIVRAVEPDVVYLHSAKAGLVGRLVVRRRIPVVFEPNAWSFHPSGPFQPLARVWERLASRWVDLFVMVSETEAAQGRAVGVRGHYVTIPHGVDPDAFPFSDDAAREQARRELGLPDAPTAVCVGRLCEQKGQDLLFDAWTRVLGRVPDAQLVLVGDGPDGPSLRRRAPAHVHFAGDRSDVHRWLTAADVAAVSSRWEAGISFATIEAWSTGRPVVTFDMSGMGDQIRDAGAAVPLGDTDRFAYELALRLADPQRCAAEGRAGRRRVETELSEQRSVESVTAAVQRLLVELRAGPR
ncbi:MAG: glycosyltransferase [Acidimicrobiales bacterium]|jgi:glycosyltransferase involved in cell wall biosynthesis